MNTKSAKADDGAEKRAFVLSKATLSAAKHLNITAAMLGEIIGASGPSISRSKTDPGKLFVTKKSFELAVLFVRLFRSLDAMTGGDDRSSQSWLSSENLALRGRPVELIQNVEGLTRALFYVDTRRAKI